MKNIIEKLSLLIFPKRCAYCNKVISADRLMCKACEKTLPRITKAVCPLCGREKDVCSCRSHKKYFDTLTAPFYYEGNVRKGLHIFKFGNGIRNAEAYAVEIKNALDKYLSDVKIDYVCCVPMTPFDLKERGYNQSEILAKRVAGLIGSEYVPGLLIKIFETQKQHNLNYLMRTGNLAGALDVGKPEYVSGKTILVCDDISTSGETLNECAKMLWLYDAGSIRCAAVALTKKKKKEKSRKA